MGDEDAFHAVVACTKATALRQAMREVWNLPSETSFIFTGNDWLLNLLAQGDSQTRAKILLLFWRAWHLRNDIIHQNGKARIDESVRFLESYLNCCSTEPAPKPTDHKGKSTVLDCPIQTPRVNAGPTRSWQPPLPDWTKVNTDGSFSHRDHSGGTGFVIRNCTGNILGAGCSAMPKYQDMEEAEVTAALHGIKLAIELGFPKVCVELDCALVVTAIRSQEQDRPTYWSTYEEAKKLLKAFQDLTITLVKRDCNSVADHLANFARTTGTSTKGSALYPIIRDIVTNDLPLATNL
jgi:ribonuclease HI